MHEVDAASLCNYSFELTSPGIAKVRIDILSLILSYANIHSGTRTLLLDDTQGMIACGALERMNGIYAQIYTFKIYITPRYSVLTTADVGAGELFVLQESRGAHIEHLKSMNFTPAQLAPLTVLPICHAFPLEEEVLKAKCHAADSYAFKENARIQALRNKLVGHIFDAYVS